MKPSPFHPPSTRRRIDDDPINTRALTLSHSFDMFAILTRAQLRSEHTIPMRIICQKDSTPPRVALALARATHHKAIYITANIDRIICKWTRTRDHTIEFAASDGRSLGKFGWGGWREVSGVFRPTPSIFISSFI